jgi:hypothetical protein
MFARHRVQSILLGLAAAFLIQPVFGEHPNLSGSWQLDVAASMFGAKPIPQSGYLNISTGRHKMLHMELVMRDAHGERTVDNDWKIDDKYHPIVGDESGEVLAKWDGSVLLGKHHTEGGMEEIRMVAGSDGFTLTESIQSPSGTTTLIWRRR